MKVQHLFQSVINRAAPSHMPVQTVLFPLSSNLLLCFHDLSLHYDDYSSLNDLVIFKARDLFIFNTCESMVNTYIYTYMHTPGNMRARFAHQHTHTTTQHSNTTNTHTVPPPPPPPPPTHTHPSLHHSQMLEPQASMQACLE